MKFGEESTTSTNGHTTQQAAPAPLERRDEPPSPRSPEPALVEPDPSDEDEGYGHGV